MTPHPDQIDLAEYAHNGSREALGRLVKRHIDFVYGVARRETGDAHLAEDVVQAVFLVLSKRAARVKPSSLTGWLFSSTCHISANARRSAMRRRHHEQQAASNKREHIMNPDSSDVEHLKFHLHAALAGVGESDRSIVLMRYMEGLDVSQIGQAMDLSEGAARKRLERAMQKLRKVLSGRGIALEAVGVGAALTALPESAPAGLTAAVMGGTASATSAALVGGAMALPAKAIAAVLMIGLAGLVTVGTWMKLTGRSLFATTAMVMNADPASTTAQAEAATTVSYSGIIEDPDGKPLAGVRVWSALTAGDPVEANPLEAETTTDAAGRYALPPLPVLRPIGRRDDWTVRYLRFDHPAYGIAWRDRRAESDAEFDGPISLVNRMEPATTLAVRVVDADGRSVAGAEVVLALQHISERPHKTNYGYLNFPTKPDSIKTDAFGLVEFTRIPKYARAHVQVTHPDFVSFDSRTGYSGGSNPVRPGYGAYAVTLERGGRMRLKVPVVDGQPLVRAAQLFAMADPPRPDGNDGRQATFSADGTYLWSGLKAGQYKVGLLRLLPADQSDRIWLPVREIHVTVGQTTDVTIEPVTGQVLAGRIVDQITRLGLPGSGVSISAVSLEVQPWYGTAMTGADGRFSARVPVGELNLEVTSYPQGHHSQLKKKVNVPAGAAASAGDIEVLSRPMARGRLVDASGKPISGMVYHEFESTKTAADGSFVLEVRPDTPDRHLFAFSSDKTLGVVLPMDEKFLDPTLALPGAQLPTIGLKATCVIAGELVDTNSKPLADAKAMLFIDDADGEMSSSIDSRWIGLAREGNKFIFSSVPAAKGIYLSLDATGSSAQMKLEALNPGEIRDLGAVVLKPVVLRSPTGIGPAPVVADNRDFSGSVMGRVLDAAGNPLAGIRITAAPEGDLSSQKDDHTDHEGRFIVEAMPKGEKLTLFVSSQVHQPLRAAAKEGDQDVELRLVETGADLVGKPAPELVLADWLVGGPMTLEALRGKVVLLDMGVDVSEFGYGNDYGMILRLFQEYQAKGLAVIAIHVTPGSARPRPTTLEKIREYVGQRQIPFPMAVDSRVTTRRRGPPYYDGETSLRYGIEEPAYIVIDKKGIVRAAPGRGELGGWINRLLAE